MTPRRIAFLFPGQGAQRAGMGRDLHDRLAECRAVFEEADRALAERFSEVIFDGTDEQLALTENTQPAILTVSVAAARALLARGVRPSAVAGHSLGEYSAVVAAGGLEFAAAVRLVRSRGRYMQEAVPVGRGAMAAIIGLDEKAVDEVCAEASRGELVVGANHNAADQIVVAGHADAVKRAVALAEVRGARRAVMLTVSAPFHCALMEPARLRLEVDLAATSFAVPEVPVMTNVDASYAWSALEIRDALVRQVTAPVRWYDSVRALVADGMTTFVELGPGKVLSALVRRIDRSVELFSVEDANGLEKTARELGGWS